MATNRSSIYLCFIVIFLSAPPYIKDSSLRAEVTISGNTTVHTACVICIYHMDIWLFKTHHADFSVQANYEQVRLF